MMIAGEDPTFGSLDKFKEFDHFGETGQFGFHFCNGIGSIQTGAEENIVNFLDRLNGFLAESVAAQSNDIEPAHSAVSAVADHERGKIHRDLGAAAEDSHSSHPAELVHPGEP